MPYQQLIPRPTDQLNVSQGDIQQNFLEIYNWVAINHAQFDTANAGKHTQVTLPENVAPTLTNADEANIYSQLSPLTAQTELYWQRENAGPTPRQIIEWTGLLAATDGWTRLPSGILLKWGIGSSGPAGNTVIIFPVGGNIPPFQNIAPNPYTIFLTPYSVAATPLLVQIRAGSLLFDQFTVDGFFSDDADLTVVDFYYIAIGI